MKKLIVIALMGVFVASCATTYLKKLHSCKPTKEEL